MNPTSVLQSAAGPTGVIAPNTAPSLENTIFDPTFYGLTIVIAIVALYVTMSSLSSRNHSVEGPQRNGAVGTGLAALGFAIIMVSVTSLLALVRVGLLGGLLYLQLEFGAVYVGCALLLLGVDRVVFSKRGSSGPSQSGIRRPKLRATLWLAFLGSLGIASVFLLTPELYTTATAVAEHHVVQQGEFWLPPVVTIVAGTLSLSFIALRSRDDPIRRPMAWFALFFSLNLFGALRESTVIPSSGDPFVDLLVAFVPFTLAGFCLLMSAMRFRHIDSRPLTGRTV